MCAAPRSEFYLNHKVSNKHCVRKNIPSQLGFMCRKVLSIMNAFRDNPAMYKFGVNFFHLLAYCLIDNDAASTNQIEACGKQMQAQWNHKLNPLAAANCLKKKPIAFQHKLHVRYQ